MASGRRLALWQPLTLGAALGLLAPACGASNGHGHGVAHEQRAPLTDRDPTPHQPLPGNTGQAGNQLNNRANTTQNQQRTTGGNTGFGGSTSRTGR